MGAAAGLFCDFLVDKANITNKKIKHGASIALVLLSVFLFFGCNTPIDNDSTYTLIVTNQGLLGDTLFNFIL